MVARFLMLQSHYRSKIDFSNEALAAAEKGYNRLMNAVDLLQEMDPPKGTTTGETQADKEILDACERCHRSMNDDLNTAQVLAALFDLTAKINAIHNKQLDNLEISSEAFQTMKKTVNDFVFDILGLKSDVQLEDSKTEELIQLLIDIRKEARENKDFATSDRIRDDLQKIGIRLKDDKSGTTFEIDS